MNLPKLLGLQRRTAGEKPASHEDILYLWEDDYLMVELIPHENLEFVKAETRRINDFANKHSAGMGFTDITPIGEKPVKTIEKLIDIALVESLMVKKGLEKIPRFYMQGVGLLQGDKAPLGFGTNKYAVMCGKRKDLLENIWITGQTGTDQERLKLVDTLLLFGQTFNFIAVNWYCGEYYNLVERNSVEDFVANSC